MTKYEVRLYVLVDVEAETPQEAERLALENGKALIRGETARVTSAIAALDKRLLGTEV